MPLHKRIAIQVKSGNSYFNPKTALCKIPVENHFDYWVNHDLPVIGIVYVPSLFSSYWVDIKKFLNANNNRKIIRFEANESSEFSLASFKKIVIPYAIGEKTVDLCIKEFFSIDDNRTLLQLFHLICPILLILKPIIYNSFSVEELLNRLGWTLEVDENSSELKTTMYSINGVVNYNRDFKLIKFDNESRTYFDLKFMELKKILIENEYIFK